ncbi:MAG: MoxR family ATPase [Victivallales bacterium]|nr:MoxR family ATPase [Victivallales bacterium]
MTEIFSDLSDNLKKVIKGKDDVIGLVLTALFSGGNILMDDVPGVGKTTFAKALALSISCGFQRVQFTPDLLPSDITGSSIFDPRDSEFHFRQGPIFTNIFLADEINRASPRTQSALLEAMNECQVTAEGRTYKLEQPFLVIATQNPVEYHGTYPLPEAQLDRFAMRLEIGYPDETAEMEIMYSRREGDPILQIKPVIDGKKIMEARNSVEAVGIEESVGVYMTRIVRATREDNRILLGASPRALIALSRASQARAFIEGRDYVLPEDVKELAPWVLSHRLLLENKTRYSGTSKDEVLRDVLDRVKVPL